MLNMKTYREISVDVNILLVSLLNFIVSFMINAYCGIKKAFRSMKSFVVL